MDSYRTEQLKSRLRSLHAGCHLLYEETCGSTNDLAAEAWEKGCAVPCVFLTDYQTSGRGRFNRVWENSRGSSLMFSLLFEPSVKPRSFPMLTEVFALAACRALQKVCKSTFVIKWPNDLVFRSRKVCGILTCTTPDMKAVIIGAGINIQKSAYPPELSAKAVSLEEVCESLPDREDLLLSVLDEFFKYYDLFASTEDMSRLKKEYESFLINIGRRVRMTDPAGTVSGTAKGIDEKGRLIFLTDDGKTVFIDSGEVSVHGLYGE